MAYLVLARKYRPQTFADMTGQEHVVQTLTNAIASNRVAHAHLFCGPRGCGKTTTARIVARALNCEKGPTPNPCGVCGPCVGIAAGTDVDVQEIDAASNTGVDNVRELRESAKYLPAHDRFKIFIVDEVHMLSKAAFNAFLKTLEEPPGHVKFLFATTDPQALPDTILSRCQRHNFRLVPLKQIAERIQSISRAEKVVIDDGAVALIARQAAGSMRDALSLLDQVFSACGDGTPITAEAAAQALGALDQGIISRLAGALVARDAKGVLEGVGQAYDGGHDLKRLAEDLATHLRNLVAASVAGAPLDLPDHELKTLREQAAKAEPAELARLFELVHGVLFEIGRATQPRHALEIALLRAVYLAPATSVQTLLARTDEIARRLGGEPPPPSGGARAPAPSAPAPAARPRPASFDAPPSGGPSRASAPALVTAERPAPGKPWERHLSLVPAAENVPVPAPVEVVEPPVPIVATPIVAAVPADDGLAARWPSLVEGVRGRKKLLGSALEHARPLSLSDGELSLGFLKGEIHHQNVERERAALEAILGELLQRPTRLKIVELQPAAGAAVASLAENNDRADREARDARLKTGRDHPAVQRVATILGAEVEEVRDLGGGSAS